MPKILLAEGKQEVSSFNPAPSSYHDFDISYGDELYQIHRGGQKELGGALSIFDAREDIETLPTYSFRAITSGGTLAAEDFNRIARECLEQIAAAPPVDAVYIRGISVNRSRRDLLRKVRAFMRTVGLVM